MAQQGNRLLHREKLCCSICLEVLKDAVTIPCGHSYCKRCIKDYWDTEEVRGTYSCPQCRKRFAPRPELVTNIVLADLVEELKKTGLQTAPADHCYAGPQDVACDFCTERKLKAVKSCLVCLVSYCENHLRPHLDVAPLKKHKLVEPFEKLQKSICPQHDEVMKMFCRTDQQCICHLCSVDQHKGHDIVLASAERTEKQKEVEETRLKIQQKIQDTEGDVKLLQQEAATLRAAADAAVQDIEKYFTKVIIELQRRRTEVKQQIRSQQGTEECQVKELQRRLEQEITELKRRDAELEQLTNTQNHTGFLQDYSSQSTQFQPSPSTHPSCNTTRLLMYFQDLREAVEDDTGQMQDILKEAKTNISLAVDAVDVLLKKPEQTRQGFFKYSKKITLDPNTANKYLLLSAGNRRVKYVKEKQSYSDHPDRFTFFCHVLSNQSLTGQCYWEVKMSGRGGDEIAVTYKNISRAGDSEKCEFGKNDKSWSLICYGDSFNFLHKNILTRLSGPASSRVGVYLDHTAGVLSFYSVNDTMSLLHRVHTTFTQPLYAGVYLHGRGSTAEFCQLK